MTAPLKAIDGNADLPALMTELANRARAAARVLALASPEQKNRALDAIARAIRANAPAILSANAEDVAEVRAGGATTAFIDRLTLTPARIEAMAEGIGIVRGIADPIGIVTESWQRPNGMTIERVRVPLGVVGVIFESRPNVAADAAPFLGGWHWQALILDSVEASLVVAGSVWLLGVAQRQLAGTGPRSVAWALALF